MAERHRSRRAGRGTRRVVVLAYPDAHTIDVTGPLEVFATASRIAEAQAGGTGTPAYSAEVVAPAAGPVRMSSGLEIVAKRGLTALRQLDTLVVAGGIGSRLAAKDAAIVRWVRRSSERARRVASVCTDAFLLAEAGLLDGRRATTHWGFCRELAACYPSIDVDPDPIFVRDGDVYTSAGVTAGMDLALALVEDDLGREVALGVARMMVLYLKRPGGQSQFSVHLEAQLADREPLRELQAWIGEHPAADLGVERLAERVAMSPRNFARVFAAEVGATPARFVERTRVEAARRRLEDTDDGVERIAADCGFGSAETLRRAFLRNLCVAPAAYRSRFRRGARGLRDAAMADAEEQNIEQEYGR